MAKVYGFNSFDAESLVQLIDNGRIGGRESHIRSPLNYIAKTPGGGIAARSGSTVSKADCTVYIIDGTTLTVSSIEVPIFNLSTTAIAGNTYIVAVRAGGVLVAVWEDCVGA